MGKLDIIQRYLLIIRKIKNSSYISRKDLEQVIADELWKHGGVDTGSSQSTLKRDIKDIRDELGIPIKYSRANNGYYFPEDEKCSSDNIERVLEPFDILNSLNADTGLDKIVFPERRPYQGTDLLVPLIRAIKKGSPVRFRYQKYGEDKPTTRQVYPYAVKENRNRWYLLGIETGQDFLKSFGLDRLSQLEILSGEFKKDSTIDIRGKYKDSFGIVEIPETPVEEVILSFNRSDGEYLKSLPIHHSQKIIQNDPSKDEIRISLHIKITEDLVLELLSRGKSLKVIQPQYLKEEICAVYREALDRYPSTSS